MIRRAVELLLIAVVLVGGVLAWRTGRERARQGADYARLAKAAGDLTITDPAKIHILALETGEPLHYAWRIYLPPNYNWNARNSWGGGGGSWNSQATELIARVRLRENPGTGHLELFEHLPGGGGKFSRGETRLAGLIRGHEGEILVEQLGSKGVALVDPDRRADLLRLTIPESLRAKDRETFEGLERQGMAPELLSIEFGPPGARKMSQ